MPISGGRANGNDLAQSNPTNTLKKMAKLVEVKTKTKKKQVPDAFQDSRKQGGKQVDYQQVELSTKEKGKEREKERETKKK